MYANPAPRKSASDTPNRIVGTALSIVTVSTPVTMAKTRKRMTEVNMGPVHDQAGGVPEIPKYFVRSTKFSYKVRKFRLRDTKSELQVEFARHARGLLVGLRQDAREVFRRRRDGYRT